MSPTNRFLMLFTAVACAINACPAVSEDAVTMRAIMPQEHVAVLEKYCFDCHDASSKEAGVDLEAIKMDVSRDNLHGQPSRKHDASSQKRSGRHTIAIILPS